MGAFLKFNIFIKIHSAIYQKITQEKIKLLKGTLKWDGNLDSMRLDQ
jgi:hypothetical protein